MGVTNFPNGVASYGVPIVPHPAASFGPVFFVCNATNANGSDGNSGKDPEHPLATVDKAIGLCSTVHGGTIHAMPGHAETVTATNIAHDVANVHVIGHGQGASRPTFTFGAAAATITASAAGGSWSGCHFVADDADVASAFTLGGANDFVVDGNSFVDATSILNFLCIVTTSAVANEADGLTVTNNYVYGLAATDGAVVSILEDTLRLNVSYNVVDKAATSDAGHLITLSDKTVGGVRIVGNTLTMKALSNQATGTLFTGSATDSSGICADNYVATIDTSTSLLATVSTKISFIENYMSGAADASGTVFPDADDPGA